jgi:hypothetical protein
MPHQMTVVPMTTMAPARSVLDTIGFLLTAA